uniref:Uncharacterized protein n=1 Tax=Anguilla anguilla TaxID=7936 RepID=A0A0E9V9H3_ANGAN
MYNRHLPIYIIILCKIAFVYHRFTSSAARQLNG